jgi:hypothetical protein
LLHGIFTHSQHHGNQARLRIHTYSSDLRRPSVVCRRVEIVILQLPASYCPSNVPPGEWHRTASQHSASLDRLHIPFGSHISPPGPDLPAFPVPRKAFLTTSLRQLLFSCYRLSLLLSVSRLFSPSHVWLARLDPPKTSAPDSQQGERPREPDSDQHRTSAFLASRSSTALWRRHSAARCLSVKVESHFSPTTTPPLLSLTASSPVYL